MKLGNTPPLSDKAIHAWLLSGILVLGFCLRFHGVFWGLPNMFHPTYSYHPDEIYLLQWADMLFAGKTIPKHFIYGGTFYYSTLQATNRLGEIITGLAGGQQLFNTMLTGRMLGILYAEVTIFLTCLAGSMLFHRRVGLLAALFLAVMPGHIFWAQRIRPDELFTLLVAVNLFFVIRMQKGYGAPRINIILAGLALGVSIATRFPAAVLFLAYAYAIFSRTTETQAGKKAIIVTVKHLLWLFGVVCLSYLAASPHTVIYYKQFVSGMMVQWHYQSGDFVEAIGRGPRWLQYGGRIFSQAAGYPLYIITLAGILLSLVKRRREDLLLLCIILPYFILLSMTSWVVVRYSIPLLPMFAILASRLIVQLCEKYRKAAITAVLATALSLLWTITADIAYSNAIRGTDARDAAAGWMIKNAVPGSAVGAFIGYPGDVFYNPPGTSLQRWYYFNMKRDDIDLFLNAGFDYVIINDHFLREVRRLGGRYPQLSYRRLNSWNEEHPGYELVQEFSRAVRAAGLDFGYQFTAPDYILARPHILIYKKLSGRR